MVEFLLSIVYFFIFCFLISKMSLFNDSRIPKFWFVGIFGIKIIVSIILTTIYSKYYTNRDTADIFKYFDDSMVIFEAIKTNPLDYIKMTLGIDFDYKYYTVNYYQYMNHWTRPYSGGLINDSHLIIRLNALIRLFSFGHFQVHNVFINFISLIGLTSIYKAFKPLLLNKEKVLFYLIFLIPSVLFWGSGLLKESIIFLGMGLLLNHLFQINDRFKISSVIFILIGALLIAFSKLYILIILLIPILGYLMNSYLKLKKNIYGYLISFSLFIISINVVPLIYNQLDLIHQIANKQQTFSRFILEVETNSGFTIPELSNGLSIIENIPNALLNSLIRPFFWECNSLFVWLSALENLLVLICLLIAFIYRKTMSSQQQNIFIFNLLFVFCLFSLIGLTTPVFGAIIRYKIPGLILLLISLLLLVDLEKIKSIHPFLNKIL